MTIPTNAKILITGGAGFIGSAMIRYLINKTNTHVVNIDKLTYAGNLESLQSIENSQRYQFIKADITDKSKISKLFLLHKPDLIMHFAAESHVDRSIDGPRLFFETNIMGTFTMLEIANEYYKSLSNQRQKVFRFHHISTDEVYGDLGKTGLFNEDSPYKPSSPYSASKASSDHLVRAWHRTYNLPILVTNCSNNYGPFHFPEKLIPLIILNALDGKKLPIYGNGKQIRDWLYVEDHVRALHLVLDRGSVGETYNIGGFNELENIQVVKKICNLLEELAPENGNSLNAGGKGFMNLICHVDDRPGHDTRYAIDATKIQKTLGWHPEETFESGLRKTIEWYISNQTWCRNVLDGSYMRQRLGELK